MAFSWTIPLILAVAAHPGPSLWGDFRLSATEAVLVIEGAADPLTTNLGAPHLLLGRLTAAEREASERHVERFFRERVPVELDGVPVRPALRELIVQDGPPEDASFRSARIVLAYPCERMPRKLSIVWPDFEGEGVDFVPMTIQRSGEPPRAFSLWPDHPGWTWHADDVRPRRPPIAASVPSDGRSVPLPLGSLGFVVAALAAAKAGWRSRRRLALATAGLLLVGAALARDLATIDVPLPWGGRPTLPAPSQARAIFESLHENVYAAFSAESEDAIYELLAASVVPEQLDALYGEVIESLILRQDGGAVCSIAAVEPIAGGIDEASYEVGGAPEFAVDWTWRVKGIVSHWGHVHERVNRFRATYVVRHDGESWKIADVDVKEHEIDAAR